MCAQGKKVSDGRPRGTWVSAAVGLHGVRTSALPMHGRTPPLPYVQPTTTCVNNGVLSAMILIASLFAPTVPSEPMPQNMHWRVPAGMVLSLGPRGRCELRTSSMMPTCGCMGVCKESGGSKQISIGGGYTKATRKAHGRQGGHCTLSSTNSNLPSLLLTVKRLLGLGRARLSYTETAIAGVNSLEPRP